jgi:hypothetical protein
MLASFEMLVSGWASTPKGCGLRLAIFGKYAHSLVERSVRLGQRTPMLQLVCLLRIAYVQVWGRNCLIGG